MNVIFTAIIDLFKTELMLSLFACCLPLAALSFAMSVFNFKGGKLND